MPFDRAFPIAASAFDTEHRGAAVVVTIEAESECNVNRTGLALDRLTKQALDPATVASTAGLLATVGARDDIRESLWYLAPGDRGNWWPAAFADDAIGSGKAADCRRG